MTTAIVGRVWIEWPTDPAPPWGWNIYLEGSTKPMDDVLAMQISVEVHSRTVVDLRRSCYMAGTERYELIAAPPKVHIPTQSLPGCTPPPTCGTSSHNGGAHRKGCPGLTAAPPARTCDECNGTGEWENPVSGKRSPCSQGCKP